MTTLLLDELTPLSLFHLQFAEVLGKLDASSRSSLLVPSTFR